MLHCRTAYEDHPSPVPPRHLLRLWLAAHNGWPLPEAFYERYASRTPCGRPAGIELAGTMPTVRLDPRAR